MIALKSQLRIGILAPIAWRTPPLDYGGWELVTSNLTEGLVKRGHDVTLFATADSLTTAHLKAICPQPLNQNHSLNSRVYESLHLAQALELTQVGEFDLLHNNAGCFPVCASRLLPVPMLSTLHGSAAEEDSRLIYSAYREQAYVSISHSERSLAPELNYRGTVYNGIDTGAFTPVEEAGDYLVVIGRMSPDKGVHLAVEVARRTGRKLILAGIIPPENQHYFDQQIKIHLAPGKVEFIGSVGHAAKNKLLGGAFAFLHLVTYREAFGLTMVEAMACGTPVVGVQLGSVGEIVQEGLSGALVPALQNENDLIESAVEAVERAGQLDRKRVRCYAVDNFGIDQMVEGYLKVYEEVIQSYKSGRNNSLSYS